MSISANYGLLVLILAFKSLKVIVILSQHWYYIRKIFTQISYKKKKNASFFKDDFRSFSANYCLLVLILAFKSLERIVILSQHWFYIRKIFTQIS